MENKELAVLLFLGFLTVFVTVLPQDLFLFGRLLVIIIIGASCLLFWFFAKERKNKSQMIPFATISLHYPFQNVVEDNYNTLIPELITNNRTREAYLLSKEILQKCVKEKGINSWFPHKNSRAMRSMLLKEGYNINDKEATWTNLDMILKRDGSVIFVPNPISETDMAKLIEQKNDRAFDNYELVFIHHWHHLSRSSQDKNYPTDRRVLFNYTTRTARPPPLGDLWLAEKDVFKKGECYKRIPCTLYFWVFCHYFFDFFPKFAQFKNQRYEISELMKEENK